MKSCRACFRDPKGVEHAVFVQAVHRYHAFGLALDQMRQCQWCRSGFSGLDKMSIEVCEKNQVRGNKPLRVVVTRAEFDEWLGDPAKSHDDPLRQYLGMLLGRIDPSREFLKHMKSR